MICKKCGTLYNAKAGPCPRCSTEPLMEREQPARDMSEAEAKRLRKRAWIQLAIGIPALIGFIYLLAYLYKLIKG